MPQRQRNIVGALLLSAVGWFGSARRLPVDQEAFLKVLFGAAAVALALTAAPAQAATFAQFKQADQSDTVSFNNGTFSNAPSAQVLFDYLVPMPAAVDGEINAFLILSSIGSPYDGALSFRRASDNANLLTASFTDAPLVGGGSSAVFFDSQPGVGNVVFSSDFLDFSSSTARDFALSFSGLSNGFGSATWTADATGTFAANSIELPGGFIPEPATWGMMILGFGGAGVLLRRRRAGAANTWASSVPA